MYEESNYVFKDKNVLIQHLYRKIENMSNIRLQKTLYLLFAFYGATYGMLEQDAELTESYPKYLFNADFEAWRYGPVDNEVYSNYKNGCYDDFGNEYIGETVEEKNALSQVNDLIEQANEINDFGLVDRTHQDESWSSKYQEGVSHIKMDSDAIIKEYAEKYVKRSAK